MQKSSFYSAAALVTAAAAVGFAAARVLRAKADEKLPGRRDAQAGHSPQDYSDQQNWPADENIKPTQEGGFAPAYNDSDPDSTNNA
ncbi:hypothetical protein J3454_15915 [Erythrobacter sp. NFXS35]|uniref:hypothetical protein n=1 Tax=Erythrobacter sp. NFXS35 TaxID=2818436 RepID=UPI0032E03384